MKETTHDRLISEFKGKETWDQMINRTLDELARYREKEREDFD